MNLKRAVIILVLVFALVALAIPLANLKARASAPANNPKITKPISLTGTPNVVTQDKSETIQDMSGKIKPEVLEALGIQKSKKSNKDKLVAKALHQVSGGNPDAVITPLPPDGRFSVSGSQPHVGGPPLVGQPLVLNSNDALSAALITTIGGRDTQFSEVALIADWDGREDCTADRGAKIDDFSTVEPDIDFTLTRAAISEHTRGNGHPFFNVYYYGDSLGNVYMGVDLTGNSLVDIIFSFNVPALVGTGTSNGFTLLNPTAGDFTDDQVTISGIAVNPVADLGDFSTQATNLCGVQGEVVYISIHDTEGGAVNAANQPIRSRIFAFGLFEGSNAGGGFIAFTNVRQIMRSKFSNVAGVAVDDDGSLYYHLVDLIQFTGGAIFKATELCRTVASCGEANPRINRVINLIPDPPNLSSWNGTAGGSGPILTANGVRNSNYGGGSSTTFGNVVSIATGSCNVLFAAVSRSLVGTDDAFTQTTEGLFPAPAQFTAGTPSMVISFADCSGAFDICSGEATGGVTTNVGGTLPVANGIADVATATTTTLIPGVNNFRIFVQGNGPDLAPPVGGTAVVPGTPAGLLKVDMQIDFSGAHSGLAVNEEGTVFVISGASPAGGGKNPSAMFTDILCFEDACPMDRRADFVDLRGNAFPNPPASGGNVGDGDSDKFDHLFYQAPIDQVTLTPTGLAGLARGFLRYTNRLVGTNAAAVPLGPGVTLGATTTVLGDDDTSGQIIFENLDPGHQVAGGDDQNTPFRGDDNDGAGSPPLTGLLSGGFEFTFGGPVGTAGCTWNGFFWNSNGNITFGTGDTSNNANVPDLRTGAPRIAPAWTDLNPSARNANLCTFPVQALGFANVNAFRVRWINVPEFGSEACVGNSSNFAGATNTFSATLYDDGTGAVVAGNATSSDENNSRAFNAANPIGNNSVAFDWAEGPTDLRFTREPNTGILVGCPPRRNGSGQFIFEYCRMDLLGRATENHQVITGYSIGGLDPLNPPGLCESNLSELARAADNAPFGVLTGGQVASIQACLIGEGTEPTIFELFNEGLPARTGSGGEITFAKPDFDLRFEGNDAGLCTSTRQTDLNRGKVGFFGIGCEPPANPQCVTVVASPFVTTPTTTGLVNALCAVQLNAVGCGFFPNETTIICQGFNSNTGVPLQRNGKTVSTTETLACDTNGDGIPETVVALTSVTPVSVNLVRGTIPVSATFGATSSSGFPAACCGGAGTLTITTTFTSGDNNAFGPFTRVATCAIALGNRAPVVFSVTPSQGNCGVPQDLLITGACFVINGVDNVTSVFAVEVGNPNNRINAAPFVIQGPGLIDAFFNFGTANAGKTFLIFVSGPNGTSRNLTSAVAGAPAGCPLGNEQGVQVTFKCDNPGPPPPPDCNANPTDPRCQTSNFDIATVNFCQLNRTEAGGFTLTVTGSNIESGAKVTISKGANSRDFTKLKFKKADSANTGRFTTIIVKGSAVCNFIPGQIVVTNIGTTAKPGRASTPFSCTESCPSQN